MPAKLAICTPIPTEQRPDGTVRTRPITWEWHIARGGLRMPYGFDAAEIGVIGLPVDEARNRAVQMAREMGCEWLFFLDWDVLPAPTCLKQLVYRATATHPSFDVYSGLYCFKEHPSQPMLYKGWNTGVFWDWNFGDVLTEGIVLSGMGCALLRLAAFDKLEHTAENPWFKTHATEEGTITEDAWFTRRLTETGGRILVDCANVCLCGHQDNNTGEVFCLEPDAPPVVRAGLKPLD